jgi:hypothetical protein
MKETRISTRILVSLCIAAVAAPVSSIGQTGGAAKKGTKADKDRVHVVLAKADDLTGQFEKANVSFSAGKNEESAAYITAASAIIDRQVKSADPKYSKDLSRSSAELRDLAVEVGAAHITKESTLDNIFASAHNSLAKYYQGKAERGVAAGENEVAGEALGSSANHLENSARWAGETISETGKGTIGLMRKASGALISGSGTVVEAGCDILGKSLSLITKIGSGIKGKKEAPETTAGKVVDAPKKVTGAAVETAGKTAEKGAEATKGIGTAIKKAGEKVKGEDAEKTKKD